MCDVERPMSDWITDDIFAVKKLTWVHLAPDRLTIHFDLYMYKESGKAVKAKRK